MTAFAGTVTGTTKLVDSPASKLITLPFWPVSCQPRSDPSSTVRLSALPILAIIHVRDVVAPGSIARSPGVETSIMKSENVTVITLLTTVLVHAVPLKYTFVANVQEPRIEDASKDAESVAPLEG